jgi:hypothetical protein
MRFRTYFAIQVSWSLYLLFRPSNTCVLISDIFLLTLVYIVEVLIKLHLVLHLIKCHARTYLSVTHGAAFNQRLKDMAFIKCETYDCFQHPAIFL